MHDKEQIGVYSFIFNPVKDSSQELQPITPKMKDNGGLQPSTQGQLQIDTKTHSHQYRLNIHY